jgi:hypothetical protein
MARRQLHRSRAPQPFAHVVEPEICRALRCRALPLFLAGDDDQDIHHALAALVRLVHGRDRRAHVPDRRRYVRGVVDGRPFEPKWLIIIGMGIMLVGMVQERCIDPRVHV